MKIDLHVHSSERSDCGKATEEAQIRAAIAAGLDAIVFTDHWQFVPLARLKRLNDQYAPFKIFGGIEVTADDEDFIVVGVRDPVLDLDLLMHNRLFAFSNLAALLNYMALYGASILTAVFLQIVQGRSAALSGWLLLSQPLM